MSCLERSRNSYGRTQAWLSYRRFFKTLLRVTFMSLHVGTLTLDVQHQWKAVNIHIYY